ncbi:hypothetical protein WA026_003016 [Henosepilachna vigintioctopunctata]|uniref:Uncharacterized protein n=1 Tax=Henosepilachna vigintioctopunctata TaxID=420089 RepID=A0AAW1TL83_9CUCU
MQIHGTYRVTILTKAWGKVSYGLASGPEEGSKFSSKPKSPPPGYVPQPMGTSRHAQPGAMLRILRWITTHAFPNFGAGCRTVQGPDLGAGAAWFALGLRVAE